MFSVLILLIMFSTNNECLSKRSSNQQWFSSTNSWNIIPSRSNYLTTVAPILNNYHHQWNNNNDNIDNQLSQSVFFVNNSNGK